MPKRCGKNDVQGQEALRAAAARFQELGHQFGSGKKSSSEFSEKCRGA